MKIKCFTDKYELQDAVAQYMDGDCGSISSQCDVTRLHGWPMGVWCVGRVTDMSYLFDGFTYAEMATFNDDISAWDVSSVTDMQQMFYYARAFNGDLSTWDV